MHDEHGPSFTQYLSVLYVVLKLNLYYYSINSSDDNIIPGPSKRPKLSAIQMYRTYLINTYNVRQLPADERYPLNCVKHFINLKIVDNNRNRSEFQKHEVCGKIDRVDKGLVCIEQIACKIGDSFPKLVIIEGAPGVGKTTLSWELCRLWSLNKIWRDYDLVVLLQLHDKSTHEANNLVDLFEFGDKATSQKVWEEIFSIQGKGLLFILEGLDEFPQALRETKDSCIIMKLIHGKLLPASTVVITSRPWALDSLEKTRIEQKIVVFGFTEIQVQEYIEQAIKDGAPDGLRTYIDANPHINSAMYNPLYARIVVQVYIEREENDFPNTTTELYMAYSRALIERYLADHPVEEKWNGKLHELPQSLQSHFLHLCEVAHKGIVLKQRQLIFYKDDIPKGSATLGFMNSVQSVTPTTFFSYNFLHLTLQEFLAAFHVCRTYQHKQQLLLFMETQSSMIILFLAGLTQLSDPWTKCVLPTPRVRSSDNEMVVYLNRQHILWLYETQNEQLIFSFENVVLPITLQSGLDPLYFFALGYCMAVGKFMLEIKIRFENDEIDKNHLHFLAGLKRHNSEFSSQIKVLDILWGEKPFPDSLYELFNYVPHTTQGVLHFYNGGHNSLAERLSESVKLVKYVKYVKLFNTKPLTNTETSITSLINKVSNYFETLKTLHCHIDDSKIAGELNDTILEFYMSLEYVEVRVAIRVDGSDDESQYLLFGLNMTRFKELNRPKLFPSNFCPIFIEELTHDDFTEQANKFTDHFADFLIYFGLITGYSRRLPTLRLKDLFCHSLSQCSQLEKLTIDFISSDQNGQDCTLQNLDSIFSALKENSSVRKLSCKIKVDSMSNKIIDHFCAQLQQNTSLEEIDLEVLNKLSDPKLEQIMETVCKLTLKKFNIHPVIANSPVIANKDTIVAICNVLEKNKNLEYLQLPPLCVEPDQRFLLPIANALSKNSSLKTLILDFEPTTTQFSKPEFLLITSEDTKAVGDMLEVNKTLLVLHLIVDIPDWSPIIEGLIKLDTTIEELHVPSSARESAIKCIDYDSVRSKIKYPKQ